mmetsp:Transcript_28403/g.39932  ORF Transcript_28403/g.39932 Transcript_28403/m.39932 type:complete len:229 (+) Transcript_28403:639-1325(+)
MELKVAGQISAAEGVRACLARFERTLNFELEFVSNFVHGQTVNVAGRVVGLHRHASQLSCQVLLLPAHVVVTTFPFGERVVVEVGPGAGKELRDRNASTAFDVVFIEKLLGLLPCAEHTDVAQHIKKVVTVDAQGNIVLLTRASGADAKDLQEVLEHVVSSSLFCQLVIDLFLKCLETEAFQLPFLDRLGHLREVVHVHVLIFSTSHLFVIFCFFRSSCFCSWRFSIK